MNEPLTVEQLARALYETDSGSNGYPPLHETVAWHDLLGRKHYFERAKEMLALLAASSPVDRPGKEASEQGTNE